MIKPNNKTKNDKHPRQSINPIKSLKLWHKIKINLDYIDAQKRVGGLGRRRTALRPSFGRLRPPACSLPAPSLPSSEARPSGGSAPPHNPEGERFVREKSRAEPNRALRAFSRGEAKE